MNRYSYSNKIFWGLLILVCICFPQILMAVERSMPITPAEKKLMQGTQPPAELPSNVPASGKLNRNTIGCVLPLSGPYADLGMKSRDAILLATKKFDEQNKPLWKVVIKDSHGTSEGIKEAIGNLADAENVMAIIAVTGTAEATNAASEANMRKVPLILISSKEGVTTAGEYVFQHFLTPSQQIKALVKYAFNDLNCAIFAVLYPDDDYGREMLKFFSQEVKRTGGKVQKVIPFSKDQTDFKAEINKLANISDETPEPGIDRQPENKSAASIDFEALLIPDSYSRVRIITSQLAYYNVRGFKLLGTSLWHSPGLLKNGGENLEGAILVDSFFTESYYPETSDFMDVYYTAYSREPENIEAMAYDTAGFMIDVLSNKEIKTRSQFAAALKKMENYRGTTGNISFDANRVAQKTPFILKVENGKLVQVK